MSFSARQQHCLEAMGIVPWVAKSESLVTAPAPAPAPALTSAPETNAVVESVSNISSVMSGSIPDRVDDIKVWLPSQPLGLLSVRSQSQSFVGQAEAPLLVVVDSAVATGDQIPSTPFNAEAGQLFDLMMRSINVTLGQRKLCYLAASNAAVQGEQVQDLCVPQTKAILLLLNNWNSLDTPVVDHFRLDHSALPVWRIPHPNMLLEFNQLKRQAWTSLQSLQSVLL